LCKWPFRGTSSPHPLKGAHTAIEKELLDRLLADYNYKKPEELIGENGLLKQLTKALLERALRKVTKNRGSFPNDESMLKLLYLAMNNIAKKWTMPIRDWKAALNRFSILFGDRMPAY